MIGLLPLLLAAPPFLQDSPADVEAWTEDVFHLVAALEEMHPDPFAGCPRETFEAGVDTFLSGVEEWTEVRSTAEFMRLLALLSRGGREGHAGVWSLSSAVLPIQIHAFSDGWFVVDAPSETADLVGAQVLAIGGIDVAEVAARLAPLQCHDNEVNLRVRVAGALSTVDLLAGVEIPRSSQGFLVRLRMPGDEEVERALTPRPPQHGDLRRRFGGGLPPREGHRWLRNLDAAYRMEMLEPRHTLYVQYNEVTAGREGGPTLAEFAQEMMKRFEEEHAERLVLDVRCNGGGDNTTFGPLIEALKTPAIDRPDVLFGLIGPQTFSAAGNFAAVLDRETRATLVGEPTGGAPNQYGDARDVSLPRHPQLNLRLATRYHVFTTPDDPSLAVEPDVLVPLTSKDYFSGHDPVLARVLGEN
jgi:hypothetical protein